MCLNGYCSIAKKGSCVPSCWDPNFRVLDCKSFFIANDRNCTPVYSSSFFLLCPESSHSKHPVFSYASITNCFKSIRQLMWQVDQCSGCHASEAFPSSPHGRDKSIPDQLGNHIISLLTILWLSTVYTGCVFIKKWRAILYWSTTRIPGTTDLRAHGCRDKTILLQTSGRLVARWVVMVLVEFG